MDGCLEEGKTAAYAYGVAVLSDILVVYKKNFESVHDDSLRAITEVLSNLQDGRNLNFDIKARETVSRGDFISRDLVIVLGGDGTLTSISHNIDSNTPVMGVNSHPKSDDPNGSVGFYMDSNVETFEHDLLDALEGKAIINQIPRLQAIIDTTSGNRFTTDPAMNDLLVANTHQYAPSKYELRRGDKHCKQQSSGVVFSTWLGQGAWLNQILDKNHIDDMRKTIDVEQVSTHYFVVAREISHEQRKTQPWAWYDWTNESTVILSDMHRGYVVPDGWDEVHFNRGATITVNLDAPKLYLLTFRESISDRLNNLKN